MKTIKLHLIRHGLAEGNEEGVMIGGDTDRELTEKGVQDLWELAARFSYPRVGLVFSSPMKRAMHTADILYPHIKEKRVLEDLREMRFGEFECGRWDELQHNERFRKWEDPADGSFVPEGGESRNQFDARVAKALQTMLMHQAQNGIWEAACVAHCEVIMSMMAQTVLPPRDRYGWLADNGCGYTLQTDAAMLMREGPVEAAGLVPAGYDGKWMRQRLSGELTGLPPQSEEE